MHVSSRFHAGTSIYQRGWTTPDQRPEHRDDAAYGESAWLRERDHGRIGAARRETHCPHCHQHYRAELRFWRAMVALSILLALFVAQAVATV